MPTAPEPPSTATPLTKPQLRALAALRDISDAPRGPGLSAPGKAVPRQVALALWPDSLGWKRVSRRRTTGRGEAGGALGATMPMKAATLLWRLKAAGMAWAERDSNAWTITQRGRDLLDTLD